MERIKVFVGRKKMRGLTSAEAIGEFGERVAVAQECIFDLRIVNGRKGVEDGFDFPNAVLNDIACEGNVADRCPEQHKATFGGARDIPVERVIDGRGGAAPNQRFTGVEREPDFPPQGLQQVKCLSKAC